MLGAANRDPGQFADPDRLDIRRRNKWSSGLRLWHSLLPGAPLSRLEGQIAIGHYRATVSRYRLANPGATVRENSRSRLVSLPWSFSAVG